jgi:hypothetical protein
MTITHRFHAQADDDAVCCCGRAKAHHLTDEQLRVLMIVGDTPSSEVRLWSKENSVADSLALAGLVERTRTPDWVKLTNAGLAALRPHRGY